MPAAAKTFLERLDDAARKLLHSPRASKMPTGVTKNKGRFAPAFIF